MSAPYKDLQEAMRQDVSINNVLMSGRSMSELALILANEKKALVEQLIDLRMNGPTPQIVLAPEHRRCAICGFVVDTAIAAEKPTVEFSMAGRARPGIKSDIEDTNRAGGPHNSEGARCK